MKCSEKAFQGKLVTFPERRCRNIKKPNLDLEETCNRGACPARPAYIPAAGWYSSPWQQVSTERLRGVKVQPRFRLQLLLLGTCPNDLSSWAGSSIGEPPFSHLQN